MTTINSELIMVPEVELINRLAKKGYDIQGIQRNSTRLYDLTVKGMINMGGGYFPFSGWFPLATIRELSIWTSPDIARMTDYPDMTEDGDWSGVRDSSEEAIWAIFENYVVKSPLEPTQK